MKTEIKEPEKQIAGIPEHSVTDTQVFERVIWERDCGCRSYEWRIIFGFNKTETVIRRRFIIEGTCTFDHKKRPKIMKARSNH